MTMATDLIVGFPHQRKSRRVQFAETSQLHIYSCQNVARHELWYTKSEYALMALAVREDVLKVRATTKGVVDEDERPCLMGIEHLLSPEYLEVVKTCRTRCIQAVMMEQADVRSILSVAWFGWERIALASLAETRKAALRAKKLGKLHLHLRG